MNLFYLATIEITKTELVKDILAIIILILFYGGFVLWMLIANKKDKEKKKEYESLEDEDKKPFKPSTFAIIDGEFSKNEIRNSWLMILSYYLSTNVLSSVLSLLFENIYCSINNCTLQELTDSEELLEDFSTTCSPIYELVIYGIMTGLVMLFGFKMFKKDLQSFNIKKFLYALIGLGILYAASYIVVIVLSTCGLEETSNNESVLEELLTNNFLSMGLMLISIIILAPIVEEMTFRKAFFNVFKNNTRLAVVVSCFFFGLIHVSSTLVNMIPDVTSGDATTLEFMIQAVVIVQYSAMGFGFCYSYVKSDRNVISSIITHAANNIIACAGIILLYLLEKLGLNLSF